MAAITGTLHQPLAEATDATRRAAAQLGYAVAEDAGTANLLVLKKGITLGSWGSKLTVQFDSTSPTDTRLTVLASETMAITDWGRGKRAAEKLLASVGAA